MPSFDFGTEHLARAKENLNKYFDAICFLDNLPSCADMVHKAFYSNQTVSGSLDATMMNVSKKNKFATRTRPNKLDDETMERFKSLNELDIELYNWALLNFYD